MSLAPAHSFACAFSTSSCLPTPLLAAVLSFFYRPFLLAIHQQHSPVKKKKKKEHNGNNKQKKKKQKEDEEEKVLVIIIMAATSLSMAIVPSCSSASAVKASSSSQVTTAIPLSDWLLLLRLLFFFSSTSSPSGFSCFRIIPFVFCGMRVKMRVCVFIQPCKFCFGFREIVSVFVCLCVCLFVCFSSVAVFYGLVRLCDRQAYSCRSLGFGFSFWKALSCCRGLSFRPWLSSSSEWFTLWDLYSCVHFFVFLFCLFCWLCGTKAISVDIFDSENTSNCLWFLMTS